MEWLSNVTNQMDSFGLMANDIGLDSCHLEAVDESHNENRDWNGAIKDWHLASEAEMPSKMLPRPLHSVRIQKKKFDYKFFYKSWLSRPFNGFCHMEDILELKYIYVYIFFKFRCNIYFLFKESFRVQFIKVEQKPYDEKWCVLFVLV